MSDYDKIANLEEVIAKKDAEIAQLVSVINSECNKCGDCAKFGYDCNAGDIDGNENCRACKKFVSKEVSVLRALVKGLLEAASTECADCRYDCGPDREKCIIREAAKYIEESEVWK